MDSTDQQTTNTTNADTTIQPVVDNAKYLSTATFSRTPSHTKEADHNGRYTDRRWHEVTTERLFQQTRSGGLWSATERPREFPNSGYWLRLIEVRPDGSRKKRLVDYHFIRSNGIGVQCFRCPEEDCHKSFGTRVLVKKHLETRVHPNSTKNFMEHPTLQGYPHKPKSRTSLDNESQSPQKSLITENETAQGAQVIPSNFDNSKIEGMSTFSPEHISALRNIARESLAYLSRMELVDGDPAPQTTEPMPTTRDDQEEPAVVQTIHVGTINLSPELCVRFEHGSVRLEYDCTVVPLRPMPPNPTAFFYDQNWLVFLETAGMWNPLSRTWTPWENFEESPPHLAASGYHKLGLQSLGLGRPLPTMIAWPPVQRELEGRRSEGEFGGDTTILPMPLYIGEHGGIPVYTYASYGGPRFDSSFFGNTPFRLWQDTRPWPRGGGTQ